MSPCTLHTMRTTRWRALALASVLLLAWVSPVAQSASAHARGHHHHSGASVISWNATATDALAIDAKFGPPVFGVAIAYVQAAVYNAVVGVKGGFEQYKWHARAHHGTSVDAAVAAAAHCVLLTYVPVAKPRVDAAYTAALDAIPDGWAKEAGIRFGERAAAHIVALRTGDGWMAPIQFTQVPGPGVWRPTPSPSPTGTGTVDLPFAAPWLGEMRPFMLHAHDQFRPSGPRSLTSTGYAKDLNEVKDIGSATSSTRTDLQTEIAHLYGDNNFGVQLQGAFRDHLTRHPHGIVSAARYLAGADLAVADAVITAWDAKFVYGSWRPVTAIQKADTDGNPATTADPKWQPLIVTPNHPDYLSGHTTVSGAVTTALTQLTGTSRIDLNMPSPTNLTLSPRHYEWAGQLNAESIGARIWAGIHTRTADEVGNTVGKKVGAFGMQHYFHATD
jgi:hypothetical protein